MNSEIKPAIVFAGATPFNEGNVNETYRGQVLLDDGETRQAIIKDLNLVQLCNELLANRLAKHVGLPTPDCYLGIVRPRIMTVNKAPTLALGDRLVFVSTDVKVPNVTFQLRGSSEEGQKVLLEQIAKWTDLGRLYAFDAWIANVDRHRGNLLFGNPGDAWLIDHGHSFTGPEWEPTHLDPAKEFVNKLSLWMTPLLSSDQRQSRKDEVASFEASLSGFDASPLSKSSHVSTLLPEEAANALRAFIEARTTSLTFHASKALGMPVLV